MFVTTTNTEVILTIDTHRTISCLSSRGQCGETSYTSSNSLRRQFECLTSLPAMIKKLEQPYVFAPLDQFQEFLCAEARKFALRTELQELNVDSFCNTIRAIMSNAYLSNPLIGIDFNSLGLEGWILVKGDLRATRG